jgi:hypothetical protein
MQVLVGARSSDVINAYWMPNISVIFENLPVKAATANYSSSRWSSIMHIRTM